MLMSGPLLTGYTQTINDFFDREIDAINEPDRPIPSGAYAGYSGGQLALSATLCAAFAHWPEAEKGEAR